jgi:hypothetical protein
MKPPTLDPMGDPVAAESELEQLAPRNHPVLLLRQRP